MNGLLISMESCASGCVWETRWWLPTNVQSSQRAWRHQWTRATLFTSSVCFTRLKWWNLITARKDFWFGLSNVLTLTRFAWESKKIHSVYTFQRGKFQLSQTQIGLFKLYMFLRQHAEGGSFAVQVCKVWTYLCVYTLHEIFFYQGRQ